MDEPTKPDNPPRTVKCVKFQKEMPALDEPPWPGELGQRIYENVSVDAWKLWEERMKMILNEYRLMPWQKEAQEMVAKQCIKSCVSNKPQYPGRALHACLDQR